MGNSASIHNYIPLKIIGRGSYGEVYKVKNRETNQIYAIKVLHTEFNKNLGNCMKSLNNEIEIYSKLDHPCILPFVGASYFSFNDEQRPALVVKYAVNGSLDQLIDYGKQYERIPFWDNTKILCCIYGISSALCYLHEQGVIHYDLKPSNILLDEFLSPLVSDLGISQILDNKKSSLPASTLSGTVFYTAPEIWEEKEITTACDVYSFAFVLYSIFTNDEPFKNYNQYKFFINVIQNDERPNLDSKIPKPFQKLIDRCWSKNSAKRPTFKEIVDDLANNGEYLIEGVDIEKYHKYIELINNRSKPEIMKEYFQEIDIKNELKKEPVMDQAFESLFQKSIEKLNELPLNKQTTIKSIIYKENNKINFYKIKINYSQINSLYEDKTLDSDYLFDILKFFRKISIVMQFPSINFMPIMKELTNIKKQKMQRIKVILTIADVNAISQEFKNNNAINKISIKDLVTSIESEAFRGCISLKLISLPNELKIIEHSLFRMCENLKKISIPSKVEIIEHNAFRGCHSLIEVTIPPSVKKIGKSCFRGDNHLESLTLPDNLELIERNTFKGCVQLKSVNIPSNVSKIESAAFEECQHLKKIVIPHSVSVIESNAFRDCDSLTHIYLDPSKTSSIHNDAFSDCKNLYLLVITTSESSISINMDPFPYVKEIVIPPNVISIDNPLPGIQIRESTNFIGDCGVDGIKEIEDMLGASF